MAFLRRDTSRVRKTGGEDPAATIQVPCCGGYISARRFSMDEMH